MLTDEQEVNSIVSVNQFLAAAIIEVINKITHSPYFRQSQTRDNFSIFGSSFHSIGNHTVLQQNTNEIRQFTFCLWYPIDDRPRSHTRILPTAQKGSSYRVFSLWHIFSVSRPPSYRNTVGNIWVVKSVWKYVPCTDDYGKEFTCGRKSLRWRQRFIRKEKRTEK